MVDCIVSSLSIGSEEQARRLATCYRIILDCAKRKHEQENKTTNAVVFIDQIQSVVERPHTDLQETSWRRVHEKKKARPPKGKM